MAEHRRDFRPNGENGVSGQHPHTEPERREEAAGGRELTERRDERQGFYDAARERGRRPVVWSDYDSARDRDQTRLNRDRGYEGWSAEREGGQFEHGRAGFRDFGVPSPEQGRELRDPYNTQNWGGEFEGRDDRVAGRSGRAYAPDAWEPDHPEEDVRGLKSLQRIAGRRHREHEHDERRGHGWDYEPLRAREVMTAHPRSARRNSTLRDVAEIMREENCGVVPVIHEDGRLLGLITDRDMVMRTYRDDRPWHQWRASEVMTDQVEAVTADEPLQDVVRLMGDRQIRRVPVVDRGDRLLGMLSMTDIARRAEHDRTLQEAMVRIARRRSFWSKLWT